ncbi:tripartite tricarboxylate transporter substrate binding protein [Pseudorhodoferax sp. Leaf267]|uniref:Bug family tripartite tricarboxylate transporter substrate binding protein n=1 Tax=Pseudorhodoferax sp. Leaf267 TaxID=1736316 RepID=UPI0006FB1DFD|nr:tripartite tricarboxylate transporter substrate binding protein [Pseudorhodoferax sp. Leaf267]KQP21970.1 hypothetical protein ASF43_24260 [Pseudorhodoferax sp. Leaf267]
MPVVTLRSAATQARWCALALWTAVPAAFACPTGPISLVVPYPAGGSMDAVMRVVADAAGRAAERSFLVRNIGGASGAVAVQHVLRQPDDGCTVLAGNVNTVILAPFQMPHVGYTAQDLAPVGQVGSSDFVVIAASTLPVEGLEDLPGLVEQRGKALSAGHPGTETLQYMALPTIARQLRMDLLHVPYKGSSVLINDLIGGHIDMAVVAAPAATVAVERGQVKVLANLTQWMASPAGGAQAPLVGWAGWFVAQGTPPAARAPLQAALRGALAMPEVQRKLQALGSAVPSAAQQQAFAETVAADVPRFRQRFGEALASRAAASAQVPAPDAGRGR